MKNNHLLRAVCLSILIISLLPVHSVNALVAAAPPPADMFQLPWDQGIAWYAIDGIDNGTKRPLNSSHNYQLGGAIDFAPKVTMVTGMDTSNFWVTAAADGTVIQTASCYLTISHASGWITQYFFLGKIQVKLGDVVTRNQRLGIIADGVRIPYCPGSQDINIPHLHFVLRPSILGATFAGWEVHYNSVLNWTYFSKGLNIVGLYKPLLNVFDTPPTETPTATATSTPTSVPSPTPTGPYVSTVIEPRNISIGGTALATVSLNNVPAEGYTSAEFTCSYTAGLFTVSNITTSSLFGPDTVSVINGPHDQSFIVAVAASDSNKATTSGTAFTFNVTGTQSGQTTLECRARVSQGNDSLTEIAFVADTLTILGDTSTATSTPTNAPPVETSTPTATATSTTPTSTPGSDWITFTDMTYGFRFLYPKEGQIEVGATDSHTIIDLPRVPGTNLGHKYVEVFAGETTGTCQSPLTTSMSTSETVVINGLTFLKQTGQDGTAGHINKWTAYSTARNNVCVNLDFVLRAADPGNFETPPPLYDEALESAVFGQIVGTYAWLELPTATPTDSSTATPTSTPTGSATATSTATPAESPTATPTSTPSSTNAVITGQVLASKLVTINVYDANNVVVATSSNADGTFNLEVLPGTYIVIASADGFLDAQRTVTLTTGITTTLPTINLPAGDIDGNGVINQFDAITIGMSYNLSEPATADLNNDGVINVLDLEALAKNYRKTGPVSW
jgi:hypothetical protein